MYIKYSFQPLIFNSQLTQVSNTCMLSRSSKEYSLLDFKTSMNSSQLIISDPTRVDITSDWQLYALVILLLSMQVLVTVTVFSFFLERVIF